MPQIEQTVYAKGTQVRALGEHVVIRPYAPEGVSPGGIIIPEKHREAPQHGQVLSVGEKVMEEIREGDEVIFCRYVGDVVECDDRDRLMMVQSKEILARIDRGDDDEHGDPYDSIE